MDFAGASRRWMIVAAGGHDVLIARFADFLERHQRSPRQKRSLPAADRSALFAAYLRIM
jgi:deoxyribodipyrimidine photolyase